MFVRVRPDEGEGEAADVDVVHNEVGELEVVVRDDQVAQLVPLRVAPGQPGSPERVGRRRRDVIELGLILRTILQIEHWMKLPRYAGLLNIKGHQSTLIDELSFQTRLAKSQSYPKISINTCHF